MFWPNDFEHIRWQWRVFVGLNFVGYLDATVPEAMAAQSSIRCVLDLSNHAIDLM